MQTYVSMSSNGGEALLSDKADSVELVSAKYDGPMAFKVSATNELKEIRSRLDKTSDACVRIQKLIDVFESYSYQFNIKIVYFTQQRKPKWPTGTNFVALKMALCIFASAKNLLFTNLLTFVSQMQYSAHPPGL